MYVYNFLPHPQHMELPRPGTEHKLQVQPTPLMRQHQILNPLLLAGDLTCATTETTPDP